MLRRRVFTPLFLITLIAAGAFSAMGQTAPITGRVQTKGADGTPTPVENAKVDCYRTDADLACRSTTTAKDGTFTILGIPFNATVAIAVSAPGMNPTVYPGIKAGQDKIEVELRAGDGSVIDEAEARRLAAEWELNPTGELTEEQKKAQEELERKIKEIEAKNAKARENNATWDRALKEGNEAFSSGDYDVAIVKFQEGIDVDPDFVGSAPAFLNNKGAALQKRAAETYNAGVKSGDKAAFVTAKEKAASDLKDALASYAKSYEILTKAGPGEVSDPANYKQTLFKAAEGGWQTVRIMVQIETIDPDQTEAAKTLIEEYARTESDRKKQGEALASLAAYQFSGGDFEGSVETYRKAYDYAPKDPEVLGKYSLALYTAWELDPNDTVKSETLKLLEEYLAVAPKDHKYRDDLGCLANTMLSQKKYPCSQDQ